jgi:DNA-binding NarL/FixJ family response regulator
MVDHAPRQIVVADDHPLVLGALQALLHDIWPDATMRTFTALDEILPVLTAGGVDLLVSDVTFGRASALGQIAAWRAAAPRTRIAMVSAHGSPAMACTAIRGGATGYLAKSLDPAAFRAALIAIARGESVVLTGPPRERTRSEDATDAGVGVSPQQEMVLSLLLGGHTQQEVADAMDISRKTVEYHIATLRRKSGMDRLALLLAWARTHLHITPRVR